MNNNQQQQSPLDAITNSPWFRNGGIFITLAVNVVIFTIFTLIYLICIRPCGLFNVKKKKKLLIQSLKREGIEAKLGKQLQHENIQEQENQPTTQNLENEFTEDEKQLINSAYYEVSDVKPAKSSFLSFWKFRLIFFWRITKSLFHVPIGTFTNLLNIKIEHQSDVNSNRKDNEDVKIIKFYGRDVLTYIRFHQLLFWTLLTLFIVFSIVLYPVHITNSYRLTPATTTSGGNSGSSGGSVSTATAVNENDFFLTRSSITTVITLPSYLVIHLLLSIYLFFIVGLFMLLCFCNDPSLKTHNFAGCDTDGKWKGYSSYLSFYRSTKFPLLAENQSLPQLSDKRNISTSLSIQTLEVMNVPSNLIKQNEFEQLMRKIFKDTNIINAFHVIDQEKRSKLQNKLESQIDQLDSYKYNYFTSGKRPNKTLLFKKDFDGKRKFKQKKDAISYTRTQFERKYHDIKTFDSAFNRAVNLGSAGSNIVEDTRGNTDEHITKLSDIKGSGIGYIIFNTRSDMQLALKQISLLNVIVIYNVTDRLGKVQTLTKEEFDHLENKSDYKIDTIRLRCKQVEYEPSDINWNRIYTFNRKSVVFPYIKKILLYLLIIVIFIFFTTPVAMASTIGSLLLIPGIREGAQLFALIGGAFANIFFQYLPSLLLLVSSAILPMLIYYVTLLDQWRAFGEFQRTYLRRATAFLWLNALILPTLVLSSVSGIVNFFAGGNKLKETFGKLFLPSSGALFINYILNKAVWGMIFTVVPILGFALYILCTRFTSSFWRRTPLKRNQLPKEKLYNAERLSYFLESNYAQSLTVFAICICFSILTPFVSLVGLLYFTLKYYVDRFCIAHSFSHRMIQQLLIEKYQRDNSDLNIIERNVSVPLLENNYGSVFTFRSDYVSHRKLIQVLMELVLGSLLMFYLYLTFFFATKIAETPAFIPHLVIVVIEAAISLCLIFVVKFYFKWELSSNLSKSLENIDKQDLNQAYTPNNYWNYKNQLIEDRYRFMTTDPTLKQTSL